MSDHPHHRRQGFTLIELMISVGLVMAMATVAMTAFLHIRKTVARAEARTAMHASAQRLYTFLQRTLSSIQPGCALVTTVIQRNPSASTDPGSIRLIYMRGKEQLEEFGSNPYLATDLLWEQLTWSVSDRVLRKGTSSQAWAFTSGAFSPAGVDYNGKTFYGLPQPRRYLNPSNPTGLAPGGLNDNMYFPSTLTDPVPPAVPTSLANSAGRDVGDFTDIQNNLTPIFERISALDIQIESYDGTTTSLDVASGGPSVQNGVFQGVWNDGRLATPLTSAQNYALSDLAKRPRIMRWRFTMTEPLPTEPSGGLSATFSFSFVLPGLLGEP